MTATFTTHPEPVFLDYAGAANLEEVLGNLSGCAADGSTLWTVSDEGRSVERLEREDGDYRFVEQMDLDALFPELPSGKEADLESVDVADGRVWLCGSHCRVRRKATVDGLPDPGFRRRSSRHLLGSFRTTGRRSGRQAVPALGEGSLRRRLREDPFLGPFLALPSKENGLDIEGLVVLGSRAMLGLRGPVIDGLAVVVEFRLERNATAREAALRLHFIDLRGLGIRDLARHGDDVLVLAGPVTAADGPFGLHRWTPANTGRAQRAELLHPFPISRERPETVCALDRDGRQGALVLYDSPVGGRLEGTRYRADWFDGRDTKRRTTGAPNSRMMIARGTDGPTRRIGRRVPIAGL